MEQALFGITGHKGCVGGFCKSVVKVGGPTIELPLILQNLSGLGVSGTIGVAVKCVDINRKAGAEGGSLGHN